MHINAELAKSAMRLILPDDKAVEECDFAHTADNEWTCWTQSYEMCVKPYENSAALYVRSRSTGVLSMVCVLRCVVNCYGRPVLLLKYKLEPRELRQLPDYIK